jgi:hypothetical protein
MAEYNCWTKHGERGIMMEDGEEEENDDKYRQMFPEYGDTAMEDNEEEGGDERASVEPVDDLSRVISDVKQDSGSSILGMKTTIVSFQHSGILLELSARITSFVISSPQIFQNFL